MFRLGGVWEGVVVVVVVWVFDKVVKTPQSEERHRRRRLEMLRVLVLLSTPVVARGKHCIVFDQFDHGR